MNAPARIAELERQLHWAQLKIQRLEEELRQRRIQPLGPRSETLSNLQLKLVAEQEPSTMRDEVESRGAAARADDTHDAASRPHPVRKPLPDHLPRVTRIITSCATARTACGEQTAVIGYDEASSSMSSRRAILSA